MLSLVESSPRGASSCSAFFFLFFPAHQHFVSRIESASVAFRQHVFRIERMSVAFRLHVSRIESVSVAFRLRTVG